MNDSNMPEPASMVCPAHSGLHHRVKDLEGRQSSASEERKAMSKEIVGIKVSMAKWAGGIAVALAVVNVLTAVILKVLP